MSESTGWPALNIIEFFLALITTVALLLETVSHCSGQSVRHIVHIPEGTPGFLAQEIADYRALGWSVCALWRGSRAAVTARRWRREVLRPESIEDWKDRALYLYCCLVYCFIRVFCDWHNPS